MSNPCECCQRKLKFIRHINGNYTDIMVMPEWFVNYFGVKIPGTIRLEAPNGITYDVRVTERVNRAILKSGWAAFVDANQIKDNYYLMFRYLGNACFEVTIFDSSGKEKALCCAGMATASEVKKPSRHSVDNSRRSRDGTTQSSAGEGSDSDGCPKESSCRYCKSTKTPTLSYTSDELSEENPCLDYPVESDDHQTLSNDYVLSGHGNLTEAQKVKVQELVEKIQPEIPVLVVLIKKSNVTHNYSLVISKDYAVWYFPSKDKNIILQLPRKKQNWKCKFHIRASGESGAGRRNLSFGNFVRDNNVREGDICLFQPMTNVKQRRFTVTVHVLPKANIDHTPGGRTDIGSNNGRTSTKMAYASNGEEYSLEDEDHGVSDDSEGTSEPPFMLPVRPCLTPAQEKKVLKKIEEIESDLPLYVAILNKSNVHHRGHTVPRLTFGSQYAVRYLGEKFSDGHLRGNRSVINLVLQREGKSRSWPTELCHVIVHRSHLFRVIKGWSSFARKNRLREGDLCLFKLMENKELLKMMVYIIRREKC